MTKSSQCRLRWILLLCVIVLSPMCLSLQNGLVYTGRSYPLSGMQAQVAVPGFDNHLRVHIGPSSFGLGLFISIDDSAGPELMVRKDTFLCKYAQGELVMGQNDGGDKSVMYKFTNLASLVYFRGKVMTIKEAIEASSQRSLQDHVIQVDDKNSVLQISLNPSARVKTFIPKKIDQTDALANCFGMCANDLAYEGDETTEESYYKNSHKNCCMLLWHLIEDTTTAMLKPLYPVIVLKRDIIFRNLEPMELGLGYSWGYWSAWRFWV